MPNFTIEYDFPGNEIQIGGTLRARKIWHDPPGPNELLEFEIVIDPTSRRLAAKNKATGEITFPFSN